MFKALLNQFKDLLRGVRKWIVPNREEHIVVQGIKLLLKGIVLLIAAALSPIALVLLAFAFFAAF